MKQWEHKRKEQQAKKKKKQQLSPQTLVLLLMGESADVSECMFTYVFVHIAGTGFSHKRGKLHSELTRILSIFF